MYNLIETHCWYNNHQGTKNCKYTNKRTNSLNVRCTLMTNHLLSFETSIEDCYETEKIRNFPKTGAGMDSRNQDLLSPTHLSTSHHRHIIISCKSSS